LEPDADQRPLLAPELLNRVLDHVSIGTVLADRSWTICHWNDFMARHSGRGAAEVLGKNLFAFPELPKSWLERKLRSVLAIRNYAFTSWQERPYLFRLKNLRAITGNVDYMYQDCSFIPIDDERGEAEYVLINVLDMTDVYAYENRLDAVTETVTELERLSHRDGLTALYNRRHLEQSLPTEFHRAVAQGRPLSFILADIDHFKLLNDTYGHIAGDEVLRSVGACIAGNVRGSDIAARYGGEEFAVVLPETGPDVAGRVAERLRGAIAALSVMFEGQPIAVTASFGFSAQGPAMHGYTELVQAADHALYRSKQGGRNRATSA
jgi:diguanylate cyclase